jgi:hypothetical protein
MHSEAEEIVRDHYKVFYFVKGTIGNRVDPRFSLPGALRKFPIAALHRVAILFHEVHPTVILDRNDDDENTNRLTTLPATRTLAPSEVRTRLAAGVGSHERTRLCLKFPVSRENTGNFIDSELSGASTTAKKAINSVPYEQIPYASEQGIFCGLAGN